jgi:hypothetical protein
MLQDGDNGPLTIALLHHRCEHANARGSVAESDWFACLQPDKPLDEHALFDVHCDACFDCYWSFMGL